MLRYLGLGWVAIGITAIAMGHPTSGALHAMVGCGMMLLDNQRKHTPDPFATPAPRPPMPPMPEPIVLITSERDFRSWLTNPRAFWLRPEDHEIRTMLIDVGNAMPAVRPLIDRMMQMDKQSIEFDMAVVALLKPIVIPRIVAPLDVPIRWGDS